MKKVINFIAVALTAILFASAVQAANHNFANGWAPPNWQELSNGMVPYPAPSPFAVINGTKYRLGDKGIQFHRFATGGVRVILGSCSAKKAARVLAMKMYSNGTFSELLDCDLVDNNKG